MRSVYLRPWRIDVDRRATVSLPVPISALTRTAARALTLAGAPAPSSLGLILSDDRELHELNLRHMGEDRPTDVLSFPMLPPSAFPTHAGQTDGESDGPPEPAYDRPPRQRTHLGDIVISVERAIEQAASGAGGQTGDVRWSAGDELRLLVVHGVLHVCGWNHARAEERDAMRALEREILRQR